MTLVIASEPVPLTLDADGVIRVAGARVTLDTLVEKFNQGVTAEELGLKFPTLKLAHIYLVIGYYLEHQPEVDAYLAQQDAEADQFQQENEARYNLVGIRERLLARRPAQGS